MLGSEVRAPAFTCSDGSTGHECTVALAQIPGGTLDPTSVPKYATPLLIPPVMPQGGHDRCRAARPVDYYEISMRQFTQQILPAGLPATTVWGYGAVKSAQRSGGLLLHNAPSLTIEAQVEPAGAREVDQRPRGRRRQLPAAPAARRPDAALGQPAGRHRRPRHAADLHRRRLARTPARCRSSPTCTAPSASATRATATPRRGTCPRPTNIPAGYATEGTWYDFFAGKAAANLRRRRGRPASPSSSTRTTNRASTIWYHDHTLGMTRLNVYAGPAGFYIVRGGPAGDEAVLDTPHRTRRRVLPGPAPDGERPFPPNKTYYEIPIAIQDRSFNSDGSLFYPTRGRSSTGSCTGPYIPDTDLSPIWNPEFFGNTIMVNGNTWPFLTGRAAPLPLPLPQRLPVALPDPRLRRHPGRRGLADRQRGRLPGRAGEPDGRPTATGC